MVKKINPDNSKTIYVGGLYEVDKSSGGSVTHTRVYYPAGGAMRVDGTLYYVLKDHLGSASVATDASGNIVGEDRFYPFGETRFTTGTMYTDKLFTGQREMMGLGIYHYGARFFSPKLGRFLSPDTIVPGYANPQNLNRYSYVLNNPVRYTDPSGHKGCDTQNRNGECYNAEKVFDIEASLEKKYKIKITGGWDEKEILRLKNSLNKTAKYLGGADNLNQAIQASLDAKNLDQDYLVFHNRPGYCAGKSYNCYSASTGTITISNGTFNPSYQTGKNRPKELGLNTTNMGIEVSIVHEMGHMLYTANPSLLRKYVRSVSNPYALSSSSGSEENMANAIAYYVVSGGNASSPYQYQDHLDFAASLWDYSP